MAEHYLKTWKEPFDAVESGAKRFEVRKNDRCFQTGDVVVLEKYDQDEEVYFSTDTVPLRFRIGWILQGGQFGIESGYCVFQLEDIPS